MAESPSVQASAADALRAAMDALCVATQMAEALDRLLQDIDIVVDPERAALGFAAEACIFRIQQEARDAYEKLHPHVPTLVGLHPPAASVCA